MVQGEAAGENPDHGPASWNKFHVTVAGRTNGAHEAIVQRLRNSGQTQVSSPEDSHYLLVFCPVASRVGTDIGEALQITPAGKPVILVVMHHTFNPDHIVADSRRQVDNPNVCLTVDCLFYEGKLLSSNRNDNAWSEIRGHLDRPGSSDPRCSIIIRWCKKHRGKIVPAGVFTLVGGTVTALVTEKGRHRLFSTSEDDLSILERCQQLVVFKWCKKHRGKIISALVIILVWRVVLKIPAVVKEIRSSDSIWQSFTSWCKEHPTQCCILGASTVVAGLLWMKRK